MVFTNGKGNGCEVWRIITARFDPRTEKRTRNLLAKLINPGSHKITELGSAIERWEEDARRHEERNHKKLCDGTRFTALLQMCDL